MRLRDARVSCYGSVVPVKYQPARRIRSKWKDSCAGLRVDNCELPTADFCESTVHDTPPGMVLSVISLVTLVYTSRSGSNWDSTRARLAGRTDLAPGPSHVTYHANPDFFSRSVCAARDLDVVKQQQLITRV